MVGLQEGMPCGWSQKARHSSSSAERGVRAQGHCFGAAIALQISCVRCKHDGVVSFWAAHVLTFMLRNPPPHTCPHATAPHSVLSSTCLLMQNSSNHVFKGGPLRQAAPSSVTDAPRCQGCGRNHSRYTTIRIVRMFCVAALSCCTEGVVGGAWYLVSGHYCQIWTQCARSATTVRVFQGL